jgi:hypothetical protein
MPDIDELIRALDTTPAPEQAPPWPADPEPWWRASWVLGPALALGTVFLVAIYANSQQASDVDGRPALHPRGQDLDPVVVLKLAIEREGIALVAAPGGVYQQGDRVFFRVSRAQPGEVQLWVDGPSGRQEIAEIPATAAEQQVSAAYEFDGPGTYVFRAATDAGVPCQAPGCAEERLVVE